MTQFPTLYTERLVLRQLSPSDIPDLLQYVNNRKITDRLLNFPFPYEEYHAVHRLRYVYQGFQQHTHFVFAIVYRTDESEQFVGEISLHMRQSDQSSELGFWIAEPFWKMGIATEAISPVVQFGIEKLQVTSIYAECESNNPASQIVLIKNGFEKQGSGNAVLRYQFRRPPKHLSP